MINRVQTPHRTEMKKVTTTLLLILFLIHAGIAQTKKKQDKGQPLVDPETNCQLRYYYFPNIEAYFDTQKSIYYYKEDDEWVTAEEIPDGYRGYSLYNGIYVFITDYDDDLVTQFITIHKKKFPYTKKGNTAMMIKFDP